MLNWKQDFYTQSGPLYLVDLFNTFSTDNSSDRRQNEKIVTNLILKIVSSYLPIRSLSFGSDNKYIKGLLSSLVDIAQDFLEGNDVLSLQANLIESLKKKLKVETSFKNEEIQAKHIFSSGNLKEFIRNVVKQSSLLLGEKEFDAEDLMLAGSAIALLRNLISYIESA